MKAEDAFHILTLVIQEEVDIPRVRAKMKLLVRAIGAPSLHVTGMAVGASETARLILQQYGGGKVRASLFPVKGEGGECGLELLFHGNAACLSQHSCPLDERTFSALPPFPGLRKVFDRVRVEGGVRGRKLLVCCQGNRFGVRWEKVHAHMAGIRGELFSDTEESYMENLRAKHDEVVRLLREKTEQNQLLDQSNNELLQLSNDLEELARERTIIEMSLRVADQVRNPVTVIGGMARRLLNKASLSEMAVKKISLIAAEADKIEALVKQFNDKAVQRRSLFVRQNLGLLLQDALHACPAPRQKNIKVTVTLPPEPVDIFANRRILKIALIRVLRYLSRQSAVGAQLAVELENSPEPVLLFSVRNVSREDEGESRDVDADLELVRQILVEHQAEFKLENSTDDQVSVRILFPRVFHEQEMIPSWLPTGE